VSRIKVDAIQGTSGSDTAITLSGANATVGGTLAVTGVHTIGNNAVYTSDGGAVTQNTVQGIAKCWSLVNQTSTQTILDSLNVSSIADFNTGSTTLNFTNSFSNSSYSHTNGLQRAGTSDFINTGFDSRTTLCDLEMFSGGSATDTSKVATAIHGDLA